MTWHQYLLRATTADGTKDDLYLLALHLVGRNLRSEGSGWNSASRGWRESDTMDGAFEMSLPSYGCWRLLRLTPVILQHSLTIVSSLLTDCWIWRTNRGCVIILHPFGVEFWNLRNYMGQDRLSIFIVWTQRLCNWTVNVTVFYQCWRVRANIVASLDNDATRC